MWLNVPPTILPSPSRFLTSGYSLRPLAGQQHVNLPLQAVELSFQAINIIPGVAVTAARSRAVQKGDAEPRYTRLWGEGEVWTEG